MIVVISVCGYIIWNNLISKGSVIFMTILIGITIILFFLNHVIIVDTSNLRLVNINRLGPFNIYTNGTMDVTRANRIILNESKYTKTITGDHGFKTVIGTGYEYDAFLKLDDNSSFYLGTSKNQEAYIEQLKMLANALNIELRDNS